MRDRRIRAAGIASLLALAIACHRAPSAPSTLEAGRWGGEHVTIEVATTASRLEFDCAHGDIPGMFSIDADGEFRLEGTFVREHPGPIRTGEPPDSHPAVYAGAVIGEVMTLSIRLTDTQEPVGTFALTRGSPGRIVKCL